jgi:hypothetical protein
MPATTLLLLEIFAIGSIAGIWCTILLVHSAQVRTLLSSVTPDSPLTPLFVLVSIAVVYQLGWCANWIAWRALRFLLEPYRVEVFKPYGVTWQDVRPMVRQRAKEPILRELDYEVSEMRMCRANVLNCVLISLALLTHGSSTLPFTGVALAAAGLLACQTRQIHRHHYEKLLCTYKVLVEEANAEAPNTTIHPTSEAALRAPPETGDG